MLCNGNRTEWSPIRSVIIRVITSINHRVLIEYLSRELIIKIAISEKRKIAKLCDKGKFYMKKLHKFRSPITSCPITNCPITT